MAVVVLPMTSIPVYTSTATALTSAVKSAENVPTAMPLHDALGIECRVPPESIKLTDRYDYAI